MKYNRLHINRFGGLVNRTMDFSDGIHVIYGPNESGKSTLHAFFESMLFGMERGRGKAAKKDNYTRFFPAEGSSTYGGVLEFTQSDTCYSIYRNFSKDPTGFTLMDETHGRQVTPDDEEYTELISGLTLPLYRNTVSLRQLQAATSDELPEQLKNHILNLKATGSGSLDLAKARERLKKEKKALEKELDPKAERLSQDYRETLSKIEAELDELPHPDQLQDLDSEAGALMAALQEKTQERRELLDELHLIEEDYPQEAKLPAAPRSFLPFLVVGIIAFILALVLTSQNLLPASYACFAAAAASLLGGLVQCGQPSQHLEDLKEHTSETRLLYERVEAVTEEVLALRDRQRQITETRDPLKEELWQREQKENEHRHLEAELDGLADSLEKNHELRKNIAAINLAQETLNRLAATAFNDFGNYLQTTASELISQITGGRYSRLLIGDDMTMSLEQDHQLVDLSSVSCSTLDQVYLALRIACIEFFWPEESIPLLLDESFAMYDNARMAETLSWLAESYPGQVFLFTCQPREEQILVGAGIRFKEIRL